MDDRQFDALARGFTAAGSRRSLIGRLTGAALGLVVAGRDAANARKRKRTKKRKKRQSSPLVLNAFGCVDVGFPCRGDSSLCCSGICQGAAPLPGKPDTSVCVAHNVGTCQAGQDDCLGVQVGCGIKAFCTRTTGNASFCAGLGQCRACIRDTDCEAEFGPGAACIVCVDSCPGTLTQCNVPGA